MPHPRPENESADNPHEQPASGWKKDQQDDPVPIKFLFANSEVK
jgi:hypothetical protein